MSALKGTVVLGYVDVCAAGCRTILAGASSSETFEVERLDLACLSSDDRTKIASISDSDGVILIPNAQILTHKHLDVSMITINTLIPNDICHSVANEILNYITNEMTVKELIVLSSFPCLENESNESSYLRIIDKGVVNDRCTCLKISDPFLNSMIQFFKVEQLPLTVLAVDGRKIREGTIPNKADGSKQCIMAFAEALHKDLNIEIQLETAKNLMYTGANYKDETQNVMFI